MMTTMASPLPPVPQVSGCSRAGRVPGCASSQLRRRRRSLKAAGISTPPPRRRLDDERRPRAAPASLPGLASVRSVVLDIEGTTSPISFVTDVLFPYARDNVRKHLDATYGSDETNDDIALLRAQVEQDLAEGVAGAVPVPPDEAGKDEVIAALVANVEAMIGADRKITSLKQLQGHIWRTGFEGQEIKGVVFDDVPPALQRWHANGIKTYIYSSGSREAQRLIFGNTTHGDLRKYLCGFFDTMVGYGQCCYNHLQLSDGYHYL